MFYYIMVFIDSILTKIVNYLKIKENELYDYIYSLHDPLWIHFRIYDILTSVYKGLLYLQLKVKLCKLEQFKQQEN